MNKFMKTQNIIALESVCVFEYNISSRVWLYWLILRNLKICIKVQKAFDETQLLFNSLMQEYFNCKSDYYDVSIHDVGR